MSRDGSGNYSLPSGNPVVTNTIISSSGWANPTLSDLAAALTQSLSRDGQTTPTANLTMGNFRLLSLGNAQARSDAINAGQVQDDAMVQLSSIAGTGDAITASTAPAITAYAKGSRFLYIPTAGNTLTNPTIAIDGLTAQTITQSNGLGLWSGALVVGTPYEIVYDGTNFRVQSGQLGAQIISMGSPFALRNRIIDGNFDLWTAGTSFTLSTPSSVAYTADLWVVRNGAGSSSVTVTQGSFVAGSEAAGMGSPARYYLNLNQSVSATVTNTLLAHRMENVALFEGRSATFSFWAKVTSGTLSIASVLVTQVFGTGGSANVATTYTPTLTVTTSWQKFSVRLDIPSISGQTLGTAGTDFFQVGIQFPLSTTFILQTTQWQLEDCPASAPVAGLPTPFETRQLAIEKSMAERFYMQRACSARMTASSAGVLIDVSIPFNMRAAPASSLVTAGTRSNISSAAIGTTTAQGARFELTATAAGDFYALTDIWALDARF